MNIERITSRNSSIKVVAYDHAYKDQLIELAHAMHAESTYRDMAMDTDKVIRQLSACGNIVPDRYFRLAVRGDEVLGGFYGYVHKTFFSEELLANDLAWFIKPSRRGGAAAIILLDDFEKWARFQGAKKCMVGQSTARDITRTTKLYEHCGYRVIGFNTIKEL